MQAPISRDSRKYYPLKAFTKPLKALTKAIIALEGLSIRCQQWIFDCEQLEDNGRFINYGIKEGSLLTLLQDLTSVGPLQWPELNRARVLKNLIHGVFQSSIIHLASRIVAMQHPPLEAKKTRVEWQCVGIC
jgi:hypothetical protein